MCVLTFSGPGPGPGRKGNPLIRDIDLNSDIILFSYSYIGCKRISFHGKNLSGPLISLRVKFNCIPQISSRKTGELASPP